MNWLSSGPIFDVVFKYCEVSMAYLNAGNGVWLAIKTKTAMTKTTKNGADN